MRILDRHIIVAFIKNYLISLTVLISLYVVLDMVFNFDEIAKIQERTRTTGIEGLLATLASLADYYFYRCFLIFSQLSGIIPVAAAAFTLLRMSRFNELTAWLAAGVPMLRIAMPIILVAILLNGLLIVDTELLIPRMIHKLDRGHEEMHRDTGKAYEINGMQDENRNVLFAMLYHPPSDKEPPRMTQLDIIELDEKFEVIAHTRAKNATWNERKVRWDLTEGIRHTGLRPDQERSPAQSRTEFVSSINPEEIALFRSAGFVNLLPTRRINELLERPQSYGSLNLLRMKHLRFTQPIMNVILLLLAIPAVLNHDPTQLKTAATKCLMLAGIAMTAVFVTQQMAGHPPASPSLAGVWPALMAWMPIFVFAPLSVWLLDRVRT